MKYTLLIASLFATNVCAADIACRVVGIADGDTLSCLDSSYKTHKVRLAQIDAPEKKQAFGSQSRQSLSDMAFGRAAVLQPETTDKYGRLVAKVLIDGRDINLEQVRRGMAWVYRQYAQDSDYFAAENSAKAARSGLWADPSPTAPWDWRHDKTGAPARSKPSPVSAPRTYSSSASFSCGAKTQCRQMSSCEEATYYLQQCNVTRLDKNKDGVPCEALCKSR